MSRVINVTALGFVISLLLVYIPTNELYRQFIPKSICLGDETRLSRLLFLSDLVISACCLALSVALFIASSRQKSGDTERSALSYGYGLFLFMLFLSHISAAINIFWGYYWVEAFLKSVCAAIMIASTIMYVKFVRNLEKKDTDNSLKDIIRQVLREQKDNK